MRYAFEDRQEAGRQLAERLAPYKSQAALVLGIPRGGVIVAAEVARELGAKLDVVVARKLGSPGSPELAMGAITPDGMTYLRPGVAESVPDMLVTRVKIHEMNRALQVYRLFRGDRHPLQLKGKTVIVVDDGLATGATMLVALRWLRQGQPARLIAAVPVGHPDTCTLVQERADELVCLLAPHQLDSVGQWYRSFDQVDDEQVRQVLAQFNPGVAV